MDDADTKFEKIHAEARAKIFWGEDSDSVMEFLHGRGVDGLQAKKICEEAFEEYRADVRADGRRKAIAGVAILLVGVLVFCSARFEWFPNYAFRGNRLPSLYQVLVTLGVGGFLFGGYWLVNGMFEAESGEKD